MSTMPLHEKVALLLRLHRLHEEPDAGAELQRLREEVDERLLRTRALLDALDREPVRGH